jgi:SpoVK/Ycf46/Vps4 family AAA+-type ATPase
MYSEAFEYYRPKTLAEASQLLQEAVLNDGKIDAADVEFLRKARADILQSGGVLEMVESTAGTLDDVGGVPHLKEWLAVRSRAFEVAARDFGLDPPRGVLLTGVPGCGKSLVAKTLARTWKMPLMLLDPARLYGQYVGQSEQRLTESLKTVEALAPAVLWIDEIEKGLAASAEGDSGVSERLRGTFLRWMQDRPAGTFLVATCNDPLALPAEFLRRGRFDEIFFVDLPGEPERAQIFALHLTRRKRDPSAFDTAGLAAQTDGFSGAEIEAVVVGALYRAFAANTDLTQAALQEEAAATIPLSRSRAEDISRLRVWAKSRTVPA